MTKRVITVSADCHADPAAADAYGPYLESKYQDEYKEYVESLTGEYGGLGKENRAAFVQSKYLEHFAAMAERFAPEGGTARAAAGTSLSLTSDPDVRLKELEADGVVAEVLFVNTPWPFAPRGLNSLRSALHIESSGRQYELETAGLRAYHRWLGSLCQAHPGRRIGIGILGPIFDVDETLRDLDSMYELGLRGVMAPAPAHSVPPLTDAYYEPIWSRCEELGFPLHVHVGWGATTDPRVTSYDDPNSPDFDPKRRTDPTTLGIRALEQSFAGRRLLWLLILSGVLERHPKLKVVFAELHADWVGTYLRHMDEICKGNVRSSSQLAPGNGSLSMLPSEYWQRQCFVGASSLSSAEVGLRNEIGLSTMMFGTDYPHNEGTWPTTTMWLQRVFGDNPEKLSEEEIRAILGENAIRCYGLDRGQLAAAAERCGPRLDEIMDGTSGIDGETVAWLDARGAMRQPSFV